MTTPDEAWALLTPRQQEIVRVLVRHYGSTKETAHELGIARQTVRNHRRDISARLGASGTWDAWARLGLIRTPPP